MSPMPPVEPKSSTLYLEWVRGNAPAWEKDAEELIGSLRDGMGRAYNKPGRFLDDLKRSARRLPAEHLPWFWDTVGHRLLTLLPRHARTAYGYAREAEKSYELAVDERYHRDNALLFARGGALAGKDVSVHQRWLAATFAAQQAHEEFVRLVEACGAGGMAPAADLHTRLRASAKAAGLGVEEVARVLGAALAGAAGTAVPDGLLDGAARVFAQAPPGNEVRASLTELFPTTDTDGGAWLRMLDASGAIEAMAHGWITPSGGLAGWLGRFTYHYSYVRVPYGGVTVQPMPAELFELLPRLAPRIRAVSTAVRLHESRYNHTNFDADVVDACLAEGIPVEAPGKRLSLTFWGERSRRDMKALAADPGLGRWLEGTVHARLRQGTAITRLPENPGIEESVHTRISGLIDEVAGGGLGAAGEAMATLDTLLDPPTAAALDGIEEVLAGLDLTGPLLRTLRAGVPAELGWPALDEAVVELIAEGGSVEGVTSTWPVLTIYGPEKAIALDHRGRRGSCRFSVPEDATMHTVHYVGGDFLVGWSTGQRPYFADHAFWASGPDEVFKPDNVLGVVPASALPTVRSATSSRPPTEVATTASAFCGPAAGTASAAMDSS